jgi:DNA-binding NtrC family response regulator
MEYVSAAAPDANVEPSDLPEPLCGTKASTTQPFATVDPPPELEPGAPSFAPIAEELRELERRRMAEALAAAGGVKSRAAQLIDMPIRTFTMKAKQYKL